MAEAPLIDYYAILNLPPKADLLGIENAYARLSDDLAVRGGVDETAEAALERVNEAYSVLSKPELRRVYDRAFFATEIAEAERRGSRTRTAPGRSPRGCSSAALGWWCSRRPRCSRTSASPRAPGCSRRSFPRLAGGVPKQVRAAGRPVPPRMDRWSRAMFTRLSRRFCSPLMRPMTRKMSRMSPGISVTGLALSTRASRSFTSGMTSAST